MVAIRFAIIVFPDPGDPAINRLCPPATAISAARFTAFCPQISAKSSLALCCLFFSFSFFSLLDFSERAAPFRYAQSSSRLSAGRISIPFTSLPSVSFSPGRIKLLHPCSFASITIGRTPGTPLIFPSRLNSPVTITRSIASSGIYPIAASTARAIGRSNDAPFFRTVAGARLTMIFFTGSFIPELRIAVLTRSDASFTSEDRYPTIWNIGSPLLTSASTRIISTPSP